MGGLVEGRSRFPKPLHRERSASCVSKTKSKASTDRGYRLPAVTGPALWGRAGTRTPTSGGSLTWRAPALSKRGEASPLQRSDSEDPAGAQHPWRRAVELRQLAGLQI